MQGDQNNHDFQKIAPQRFTLVLPHNSFFFCESCRGVPRVRRAPDKAKPLGGVWILLLRGLSICDQSFRLAWKLLPSSLAILYWLGQHFWGSEPFWNLLKGIPFIAAITASAVMLENARTTKVLASTYLDAARKSVEAEDYEQAAIFFERAYNLNDDRPEVLFEMARLAQIRGEHDRANHLFNELAPLEKPGYAPAHILLAKRILAQSPSLAQLTVAETHLLHATNSSFRDPVAAGLLGQIYLQTKEYSQAITQLERATEFQPDYSLMLARAYSLSGDRARAERRGLIYLEWAQNLSNRTPTNLQYRMNWAEAATFLLRFEEAVLILQKGKAFAESEADKVKIAHALGEVHLAWFDHLLATAPNDRGRLYQVMADGLRENPGESNFLQRIMTLIQAQPEVAEETRKLMRQMIASGQGVALAHLVLGTDAIEQKQPELAIKHLEMAMKLDPTVAVAANNLAWMLAFKEPPELDRAFNLIDPIANRWPEFLAYRDTRGQILAKQERWEDALSDLTAALPAHQDDRQFHETLGLVYEKLGMTDLATEHRNRSEKIQLEKPETEK